MALLSAAAVALAVALTAVVVSSVASDDTDPPLEVTVNVATLLREVAALAGRAPAAVGEAGTRATHPQQTIDQISDTLQPEQFVRIPLDRFRCLCQTSLSCSCCLNIALPLFNRSENVCQKLTYNPVNLSTNVNILINGRSFFKANVTGADPPPICIPFPPGLPFMALCLHLDNLGFKSGGFQICPGTELQIFNTRVFFIHFDCVRLGVTDILLGQFDNLIDGSVIFGNISLPHLPHLPNISVPILPGSPNISVPTLPPIPNISVPTLPPSPNISVPTVPGFPNISVPSLPGSPNISVPTLPGSPNISVPTVPGSPNISVPTLPGSPNVTVPTVPGSPNISVPTVPGSPNISVPTVPGSSNISVPTVPGSPNVTVPTVPGSPNISVPTVPGSPNISVPTLPPSPNITVPTVSGFPRISG